MMEVRRIGPATLYLGDCLDIMPTIGPVDHVITDPPYSARTHAGHNASAGGHNGFGKDGSDRAALHYSALSQMDALTISNAICKVCDGWIVWMCDHHLGPVIQQNLEARARYTFAPIPYYAPGSRVRLSGDGPSNWTIWIMVSRTPAQHRWGTLPGGYLHQPGWGKAEYIGGKPLGLMKALVNDYSRPGDLVLDPFMGSGTTGVACLTLGRRFIGIERDPDAFRMAVERLERFHAQGDLFTAQPAPEQPGLPMGEVA